MDNKLQLLRKAHWKHGGGRLFLHVFLFKKGGTVFLRVSTGTEERFGPESYGTVLGSPWTDSLDQSRVFPYRIGTVLVGRGSPSP